ncbi:hypothetical protein F5Y12DRAFT_388369 [Xylaria sp. FL1777]|nr:hypothetical protein F5Y12DRAFT_388369 [Xylaria sp. FL1777]
MPRRPSHRRSRSPGGNAQEPYRARRRIDGYEDSFPTTADEPQPARDMRNYQPVEPSSTSWGEDTATAMRPDDSVSDTSNFRALTTVSGWPAPAASHHDQAFSSNHYYSPPGFINPAWESSAVTYQHNPHVSLQDPMSPATSSPEDVESVNFLPSADSQTGTTSPSEYHPDHISSSDSTPRYWTTGAHTPSNRTFRRLSMRARQGSRGQFSDVGTYDNAAMPMPMNQPGSMEEQNDSSDSSGGTTPVDRDQYIDSFMDGGDIPWSPEFPHHTPNYQYPH